MRCLNFNNQALFSDLDVLDDHPFGQRKQELDFHPLPIILLSEYVLSVARLEAKDISNEQAERTRASITKCV